MEKRCIRRAENRRAGTSERLEKMKKIPRSIEILIYKFAQIIQLLLGSDLYAIILYGSYAGEITITALILIL